MPWKKVTTQICGHISSNKNFENAIFATKPSLSN